MSFSPPQQPFPPPYSPRSQFVSAHTRAQIVKALLLANAAVAAISLFFHLLTLGGWADTADDIATLEESINPVELLQALVALAQVAVYLATVVAFLVWLHRAYKNLPAFGVRTEQSPGWVVGNWFIPFLNLVRPYQNVKEAWIKSDPGVDYSAGFAQRGPEANSTALVGVWWGFWIVMNVAGRLYSRLAGRASSFVEPSTTETVGAVSDLLVIVAAVFAFLVVGEIDRMQQEKAAQLQVSAWPAPPPPPTSFETPTAPA